MLVIPLALMTSIPLIGRHVRMPPVALSSVRFLNEGIIGYTEWINHHSLYKIGPDMTDLNAG